MLLQQRRQYLAVRRISVGNDLPIADQAVLDFRVVYLVAELGFMRLGFAPPDDLGVGLPQTGDFFPALERPPLAAPAASPAG